jgi:hypothetical protein
MKQLNIKINKWSYWSNGYYSKNKIQYKLNKFILDRWLEGYIVNIKKFNVELNPNNTNLNYKVLYNENIDENWEDEIHRLEIGL